ncbi:MAG: metallophosphoesterase, partial [Balneolaceae bacterium]
MTRKIVSSHVLELLLLSILFISCAATEPWVGDDYAGWQSDYPQEGAELAYRLILIGDVGSTNPDKDNPALDLLASRLDAGTKSSVIFLGDHLHNGGMPLEQGKKRERAEATLSEVLFRLQNYGGQIYFIPGNHDWKNGVEGLKEQQDFILGYPNINNIQYLPSAGCPGPVEIHLNEHLLLVLLDSEWFLQNNAMQIAENNDCEQTTITEVAEALREIAGNNRKKHIVLASHHPFRTRGKHGGYFTWKEHFFPFTDLNKSLWIPLPVIGSFYPVLRNMGISRQDVSSMQYDEYEDSILNALEGHPSVITATGHDHALQYFYSGRFHHIVSGAGSATSIARKGGDAGFVFSGKGFVILEILNDDSTWLEVWTAEEKFAAGNPVFRTKIHSETKFLDESGNEIEPVLPDSIIVSTDPQYERNRFGEIIFGEHYRKSWITPVQYPVLNLREAKGGLNIYRMGGGFQTRTFFLENHEGRRFVLRSIPKDPTETVPKILQRTFVRDLVQDQISASNPFGPMIVPPIADAAGIYYTVPELYFLPDDPALGLYRDEGKNQPMLLEEFIGVPLIREKFGDDVIGVTDTESLMKLLLENPNHKIDDEWFLRTRLVDMILNDWDRHEGQFFWASKEENNGIVKYRAFPLDRDNVIFKMDGVLPWIANRKWALRQFQHFDYDIRDIAGMNFQAQHLDRRALAELGKEYWIEIAEDLKVKITDEAIEEAVRNLPAPDFEIHGEETISKLKSRRDKVVEFAERYYEYVAKELEIVGTKKQDLFVIEETTDSRLLLSVYKDLDEAEHNLIFKRLIDPGETDEVRLYGISGDDRFVFKNRSKLPVTFHLVGGEGNSELVFTNAEVNSSDNVKIHSKNIKGVYLKDIKPNMGGFTTEGIENY